MNRVPLLNRIYGFISEVSHSMLPGQKTMFQRVVLVEYPRPGIYTIAFATGEVTGEAAARAGSPLISVFLPTPPNPTTGYLTLIPRSQVIDLDMGVGEAMKMAFSGGAIVPPYRAPAAQEAAAP
jgi:uncharacterized membrane protein